MSFLGLGRSQPTSEQKISAVETEMEMVAEMLNRSVEFRYAWHRETGAYGERWELFFCSQKPSSGRSRLTKACRQKCIPSDYREGELNKGEGVCLDRCTAKYFDVHMKISEQMQQEQAKMQSSTASGSGGFRFST